MAIKSKAIRELPKYADIECVCCGAPDVVFCHLPFGDAGTGQKCDDLYGFYGCQQCHDYADDRAKRDGLGQTSGLFQRVGYSYVELSGRNNYEWRYRMLRRTQRILVNHGLIRWKGAK